jgi:hypothetical protein
VNAPDAATYERDEEMVYQLLSEPNGLRMAEAEGGYVLADLLCSKSRYRGAAETTVTALRRQPDSPLLRSLYLALLEEDDATREAELRKIADAWPQLDRPRFYLALTLRSTKLGAQEAAGLLGEILARRPSEPQTLLAYADALGMAGDAEAQRDALMRLAATAPRASFAAAAASRLLELHRFKEGFRVVRDAARRIPGWRAKILPLSVPVQVWSPASGVILGLLITSAYRSFGSPTFWLLAAISVAFGALLQYALRTGWLGRGIRWRSLQWHRKRHPIHELHNS